MLAAPMTRDPRLRLCEPLEGCGAEESADADPDSDEDEDGESAESEDSATDISDPDDPEPTPGGPPKPAEPSMANGAAGTKPVELTLGGKDKQCEASSAGATDGSAVYDASSFAVYSDEEDGTMSVAHSDGALGEQLRKLIAGADSLEELLAANQPAQAKANGADSPGAEPFDQWMPVVSDESCSAEAAVPQMPSPEDDTEPSDDDAMEQLPPLVSDEASSQEEDEEEEEEADTYLDVGASEAGSSMPPPSMLSAPELPARGVKAASSVTYPPSDVVESEVGKELEAASSVTCDPTDVVESEVGKELELPDAKGPPQEPSRLRSRSPSQSRGEEDPEVQRRWREEEELWRQEVGQIKKTPAKRKAEESLEPAHAQEEEEEEKGSGDEEPLALPVEVGPEAAEEALASRAKRRRAAAAKAWKELSPRLLCLRDFIVSSCSEDGISYEDLIKRLYQHALTKPAPSVSLSTVSRIPVSFKVAGTMGAKSKSRAPVVLRLQRQQAATPPKAAAPQKAEAAAAASPSKSKVVVVDEEPDRAAGARPAPAEDKVKADAYESRTAPLALLRAYVSSERPVLFRQGAIIFEDDRVQYPGSTLTPVREHEDGGALLNLSSLWLLGVLRERYQASASQRVCEKHGAVRINGNHVSGLLTFLLGKKDECRLIVVSERLGAVPFPFPTRLKALRPQAPGVWPPLAQKQLQQLPGCEDDEKAVRSVAELTRARTQVEASLRSLEKKRKELEDQLEATRQQILEASRQKQKLDVELATAQGVGHGTRTRGHSPAVG